MTGFIDPNEPEEIPTPGAKKDDDDDDEPADTGPDPEEVAARMKKFKRIHNKILNAIEKYGSDSKQADKARQELIAEIMELKLSPKLFDALVQKLRDTIATSFARRSAPSWRCAFARPACRARISSRAFPRNETNTRLGRQAHSRQAQALIEPGAAEGRHPALAKKAAADRGAVGSDHREIKEINRRCLIGEAHGATGEKGNGRSQPAARDFHRQEVHQPRVCSSSTLSRKATSAS